MKALRSLNPLWLFAAAAVGFAGWVAYDAARPSAPRQPPVTGFDVELPGERFDPAAAKAFGLIRPGMPQAEVQRRLGFLPPGEVGPVDLSAGYPTYPVRYRVYLAAPLPGAKSPGFVPGPHVVTLVYDARSPGHPLAALPTVSAARPVGAADVPIRARIATPAIQ